MTMFLFLKIFLKRSGTVDHVGTISFSQSPPFLENIAPITSNVHIMLATNSLSWEKKIDLKTT